MKKVFSVILSAIMVILVFPISSFAAKSGDFTYSVISESEKTCKITVYRGGETGTLVIPETIDGYTVVALERYSFMMCNFCEVVIPSGVKSLDNAFYYCKNFASFVVADGNTEFSAQNGVLFNADKTTLIMYPEAKKDVSYTVPDGVKSIKNNAFESSQLTSVAISDGVTTIGSSAFRNCSKLEAVTIPDSVIFIDSAAFYNCSELKSIRLSNNLSEIGGAAFSGCEALTEIEIPQSVTFVGMQAFYHCDSLTEIVIPGSVTSMERQIVGNCKNLKSVIIGDGLSEITSYSFSECPALEKVIIPESVTTIADDVFKKSEKVTVYGYDGSYAQTFANENDIPFIALNGEKELTKENNIGDVIINTDTITIDGDSAENYFVTIPANTIIDWETEAKNLVYKVESHLGYGRILTVSVTGNSIMTCSPEPNVNLTLAYILTGDTNFTASSPVIYPIIDKTITVNIAKEAWANAPVAEYSDILTFTSTIS